jgi:hypothetical protein
LKEVAARKSQSSGTITADNRQRKGYRDGNDNIPDSRATS